MFFNFNRPVVFDGAMGTELQKRGLKTGEIPESYNLLEPDIITSIHKDYISAGADFITTNTFGANSIKLGKSCREYVTAAMNIAKKAVEGSGCKIALDVGPTGKIMKPFGELSFEDAYSSYAEEIRCGAENGADVILIETMSDIAECKAAVLAAKENSDLPVILSLSFEENGRTFMGVDAVTATVAATSWGIDAFGVNCSVGPETLLPIIKTIAEYTDLPIISQPNAGLPVIINGETEYSVDEKTFRKAAEKLLDAGVEIIGGCCGTSPDYIKELSSLAKKRQLSPKRTINKVAFCGTRKTALIGNGVSVIGERINPTGKKAMQAALREKNYGFVAEEACSQEEAGAVMLDCNAGLPDIDETEVLPVLVDKIQSVSGLPVVIDSSDPVALEKAVRHCVGKPVINSVNGSEESLNSVLPIAAKYGTGLICLLLDEEGIPESLEKRMAIAERIYNRAVLFGIKKDNLLFDCLTLAVASCPASATVTLECIKQVKIRFGVKTVLGVSNISFGLPSRAKLNNSFLIAALGAGLDAPILNPVSPDYQEALRAFSVLNGCDIDAKDYISHEQQASGTQTADTKKTGLDGIVSAVISGQAALTVKLSNEAALTIPPLDIINKAYIPALDSVGKEFEAGRMFIPQLMASAEAVRAGCNLLKETADNLSETKGKIVLATVKGDMHDIGKNIVKILLENYGYDVIDLGRDVSPETIVSAVKENEVSLVGLSALMTTTVKNMKSAIDALKENGCDCKTVVGGAVLTREYAMQIGADFYAKDASETVKIAETLFGRN